MVDRVYPVAAVSGAPSYDGRALRQTAVAPFIAGATASRPLGARSGVRPGTPATTVSATSTTWTVQPHAGVIDAEAAAEAGPYAYAFDAVNTGTMTAADASYARIDLISVQISDPAESDGSSTPSAAIVYTPGTAAAPALPTQPARSMVIAQINVPISGGGSPSVTWVAPTLAAAGGITPATSAAFGDGTYVGQYIDDPVKGFMRWNGSAWDRQSGPALTWWAEVTAQIDVGLETPTTCLTIALPSTAPAGTYAVDADVISWAGGTGQHFALLTFAGVALSGNTRSVGGSAAADVARSKHLTYAHTGGAADVVLQVQVNGTTGYCQAGTSMRVTWIGA